MSVSLGPLYDYQVNAGKSVYKWGLDFVEKTLSDYVSPISNNLSFFNSELNFSTLIRGAGNIVFDWFPVAYALSLFSAYAVIYVLYLLFQKTSKILGRG